MAALTQPGGASALCLGSEVEGFLSIGGRLMIDPQGRFSSIIDAALLFEPVCTNPHEPMPFQQRREIAARYLKAERRNGRAIADLVQQHGSDTPNGWRVWEGR